MMRKAGRDPVWALANLVTVPIRKKAGHGSQISITS
jgi:hypothetical protein